MKATGKIHFIAFFLTSSTFLGCQTKVEKEKIENFKVNGDTITVHNESQVVGELKTFLIQEELHQLELNTAGTVKAIPNQYAEIASPFSGRVTAVHLKLGMKTKPGTPLFELASPDFMDAQKQFFQAMYALKNADLTLRRELDLKKHGVGSEKDVEEATTNFEITQKEYQNALSALKIFNVNIDQLVLGQPLVVRAPIAGEVITNDVVLGQYITAEDAPKALVAELNKVWVVGMVKEQNLNLINKLDDAFISIAAYPDKKIKGNIYHIDEIVNEETRSVQVLIECQNAEHLLKPGMYTTVTFTEKPTPAIFIPEKALLQYNDKSYVLVQIEKNKYVKRDVETGVTENGKVQIISGLKTGENIISEGAFYLLNAK